MQEKYYFCGICGAGMSALAQIVKLDGYDVFGSDRSFDKGENAELKEKFEKLGIRIVQQNGEEVSKDITHFVVSTAVDNDNPDVKKAKELNLKIIHRSELLSRYADSHKTIAVAGTSGKTTTTALIWHILNESQMSPSLINGGYLNSLVRDNLLGNAFKGMGDILVMEADESDSTIMNYHPDVGIIMNISKDHKSIEELKKIFKVFASNSRKIYLNSEDDNLKEFFDEFKQAKPVGINELKLQDIKIDIFNIEFKINGVLFDVPIGGKHNLENLLFAISVCRDIGLSLEKIAKSLKSFSGVYRRFNLIGCINDICVIDDYAHNPSKIKAVLDTLNIENKRIIAVYQPHGYTPTLMLKNELIDTFVSSLKDDDILLMPEIYYAGGNVNRNISSKDITDEIVSKGKKAYYFDKREKIIDFIKQNIKNGDFIVVMGARDNSLNQFARSIYSELKLLVK